jgi:hypothetical protein
MSKNTLKHSTVAGADIIEKLKREYKQTLESICPSKDIRALAKRLAKREYPCDKCLHKEEDDCVFPYSDNYIEELDIDPCYEGILMFLRKEMGTSSDCEVIIKLLNVLAEANDALITALEATISIAGTFAMFKNCDEHMQKIILAMADEMRNDAWKLLNEAKSRKENAEAGSDKQTKGAGMR